MSNRVSTDITAVIFDLGGVLFDIDYTLTQRAFMALGADRNFVELYSQQKQAGLFDEFEKGNIPPATFRADLKKILPAEVRDEHIDNAWNAMLLGLPESKVQLLKQLGKRYRLFLLSNTNEIHLPAVLDMMAHLNGAKGIGPLFERCYYSCRMGMRKPDKEIYDKVCADNGLDKKHTLFIDDSKQNVVGAGETGIATLHCTPDIKLEEYFSFT
jgi:putative hydrolase of the HAD superfamily